MYDVCPKHYTGYGHVKSLREVLVFGELQVKER